MTYVVTENCIKCKYMDCVEVCPVDCFYEGENMLVIQPDECIDCGVCKGDAGVPLKAIEAVIKAVENKEIPREVLDSALHRIAASKKIYADAKKPVDVTEVGKFIGLPEHFQLADIITKKEVPKEGMGSDENF